MRPPYKAPLTIEVSGSAYVLVDAGGCKLAHFFFVEGAAQMPGYLSREDAKRLAETFLKMSGTAVPEFAVEAANSLAVGHA